MLSGCTVIKPKNPKNVGLTFVNWYRDKKLTVPFDFTTPITVDTIFYAGWNITVRFDLEGGISDDGTPNIDNQFIPSGCMVTKPKTLRK